MGSSLYSPCVPSGFGGRGGFDMNSSNIFPQGVLAAITFVGGGHGDGGARAGISCELFLCSMALTNLFRVRSVPMLLEQKP